MITKEELKKLKKEYKSENFLISEMNSEILKSIYYDQSETFIDFDYPCNISDKIQEFIKYYTDLGYKVDATNVTFEENEDFNKEIDDPSEVVSTIGELIVSWND